MEYFDEEQQEVGASAETALKRPITKRIGCWETGQTNPWFTLRPLSYLDPNKEMEIRIYFIATPPDRGLQRNKGLLLLHSFLSLDIKWK